MMRTKKLLKTMARLLSFMAVMSVGVTAQAEDVTMKEIPFTTLEGVRVGNAQSDEGKTGVTVLFFPDGAKTGVDISGGGPASRETPVLAPTKEDIAIHAIV